MPEQSNDYRVVIFGAAGVGKTALVQRFISDTFRENYTPTVEDTYREVINSNKQVCTLQITDTTGSHAFPAMQRLSIEKGHAFILVFNVNSRTSIEELKNIYLEIKRIKPPNEQTPMMMVGNKIDEETNVTGGREITTSLASEVAKKWGCTYIETSAKNNTNVKELFETLLTLDSNRQMSLQSADQKKKDKGRSRKDAKADKSKKTGSQKSQQPAAPPPEGSAKKKCVVQ